MNRARLAHTESQHEHAHTAQGSLGPDYDPEMPPDFAAFRAARARALETMRPLHPRSATLGDANQQNEG